MLYLIIAAMFFLAYIIGDTIAEAYCYKKEVEIMKGGHI